MTDFVLRPATEADLQITYSITRDAMRPYVEATWGSWNELDQYQKHCTNFTPSTHRIVMIGEVPAGLVATKLEPEFLWLMKLFLHSEYRNRGLGSSLLAKVENEAIFAKRPVRLRVLRANIAAQRFYLRHGFKVVGEEPERFFMVKKSGEA